MLFSAAINAQPVLKTMMRLPDTGQTTSYTSTFGEDADYNFNTPAFILSGNGTVTDTITTLMWQQTDGGEMTIKMQHFIATHLHLAVTPIGDYQTAMSCSAS